MSTPQAEQEEHELETPINPWYVRIANFAIAGMWLGAFIGYLTSNPLAFSSTVILAGITLTASSTIILAAATGILIAAVFAFAYPLLHIKFNFPRDILPRRKHAKKSIPFTHKKLNYYAGIFLSFYTLVETAPEYSQHKRRLFRLSESRMFSLDARLFLGSSGGAFLGMAIGTLIMPGLGTIVGGGIGVIVGTLTAITHPFFAHVFRKRNKALEKITRHWFQESVHDVPWYARLAAGGFTGYSLGAAITMLFFPANVLVIPITVIITCSLCLTSPLLFKIMRQLVPRFVIKKLSNIDAISYGRPIDEDARHSRLKRYTTERSNIDLPWYVRIAISIGPGFLFGQAIGTLIMPGFGTALGGFIGAVTFSAINLSSTAIISIWTYVRHRFAKYDTAHPDSDNIYDLPFALRFGFCTYTGAAVGAALGTLLCPGLGTAILTIIGTLGGIGVTLCYPYAHKKLAIRKENKLNHMENAKSSEELQNSDDPTENSLDEIEEKQQKKLQAKDTKITNNPPFYLRPFIGALAGSAIGGALGILFPGIGNLIGISLGAIIGSAAALLSPIIISLKLINSKQQSTASEREHSIRRGTQDKIEDLLPCENRRQRGDTDPTKSTTQALLSADNTCRTRSVSESYASSKKPFILSGNPARGLAALAGHEFEDILQSHRVQRTLDLVANFDPHAIPLAQTTSSLR